MPHDVDLMTNLLSSTRIRKKQRCCMAEFHSWFHSSHEQFCLLSYPRMALQYLWVFHPQHIFPDTSAERGKRDAYGSVFLVRVLCLFPLSNILLVQHWSARRENSSMQYFLTIEQAVENDYPVHVHEKLVESQREVTRYLTQSVRK